MLAKHGAKVTYGQRGLDRLEALARRIAGMGGEAGICGLALIFYLVRCGPTC
jgi:hypothetical protein